MSRNINFTQIETREKLQSKRVLFTSQAKMITPANYRDTVEERSIAKLCGYPICPNKLGKVRPLILHFVCK